MSNIDWLVLIFFLSIIVIYGIAKRKKNSDMKEYLLSNRDMRWYTVLFSIMATQASAITFLSTPAQAYVDGMRFVQFYFGLPAAMILISVVFVPIFHKLNVYTAYEFLETKLGLKTRILTALLFLIQRGLAAGLTIYAPSIILSTILNVDLLITNILIGGLVIIYTTFGGTRAVGWTQFHQLIIITLGMFAAFGMIFYLLPENISVADAFTVAGKSNKLNAIDFTFDLDNRYSFWSGLIGGFFLQLSYFGTDQSQVQRYLTASSVAQSRISLLLNGIVKIPMQFFILLIGAMLFVFYQFTSPPLFFNANEEAKIKSSRYAEVYSQLEEKHQQIFSKRKEQLYLLLDAVEKNDDRQTERIKTQLALSSQEMMQLKNEAVNILTKYNPSANTNDSNYIFLSFVLKYLPVGLIGLIFAAIFFASMSSTSSEINALASTTVVDIYKRVFKKDKSEKHYVRAAKISTIVWGLFAIAFADLASNLGTLVEAVNILGSLFYGTILGIFLTAFFIKSVRGTIVFYAAITAEAAVLLCYFFTPISFLWYNLIGCLIVIVFSFIANIIRR